MKNMERNQLLANTRPCIFVIAGITYSKTSTSSVLEANYIILFKSIKFAADNILTRSVGCSSNVVTCFPVAAFKDVA